MTTTDLRTPEEQSFLLPLVRTLSIATKSASIVPFRPNQAQREYLLAIERDLRARRPMRYIILKARQMGFSTATEAFLYKMAFVIPNMKGMVIADDAENSQHLLGMTDLYWETDPLKPLYSTKYQAKNTLAWRETNASIRTTTAGNKKAGRSRTVQFLHASEVAFWPDAETVMTGLLQAIPALPLTFVALESTANGVGNYFQRTWDAAVNGENEYTPMFYPWWIHREYRASWINLPPRDLEPLDPEERNLLTLFKVGIKIGERLYTLKDSEWYDALAWRRWAIRNLCQNDLNKFHQEYPSTPEEAFIATGTNVFPLPHLNACYKREDGQKGRLTLDPTNRHVVFTPDISGPLKLFRAPSKDEDYGLYVIGGDPTHTTRGDYACAQVVNRRTFEQVAVWRGRIDPAGFAVELNRLGRYYNTALLAPENEGPGYATIGRLIELNYPFIYQQQSPENLPGRIQDKLGWSSSVKTKELAIGWLIKLIVDHDIIIHDADTYSELRDYVTLDGGGYGNASPEGHDDTVMALAIAIASSLQQGPIPYYGSATEQNHPQEAPWETWGES